MLEPLLGRTLVVVAHPDDESAGCGILLQRVSKPMVVYLTDGAPMQKQFWGTFPTREAYADARRSEALRASKILGLTQVEFVPLPDQESFKHIPEAYDSLLQIASRLNPDALLTTAYEGGHPDHDGCNFLTSLLAKELDIPAWEMPLYHNSGRTIAYQKFLLNNGTEAYVQPSFWEKRRKRRACDAHRSQREVLKWFRAPQEIFRPIPAYDYSRPPHEGPLNYEEWQWSMTGADLCAAFTSFIQCRR